MAAVIELCGRGCGGPQQGDQDYNNGLFRHFKIRPRSPDSAALHPGYRLSLPDVLGDIVNDFTVMQFDQAFCITHHQLVVC